MTPNDEAAVYTDISRSWLQSGGYSEGAIGANPVPATVSTGLEALDVARVGAQWTHLFANQFEANVGAALAYGFDAVNTQQWAFTGYSPIAPYPISNSTWCEWGARVGYRLGNRMVVDAFAVGTLGGQIGATIHGGVGLQVPVLILPARPRTRYFSSSAIIGAHSFGSASAARPPKRLTLY